MKNFSFINVMAITRITATAFILLASLAACEKNPKEPGYEIKMLTDMVYPVPYESFQNMQMPVAGSIPRGFKPFHYGKGEQDAVLAGQELQNTVPLTKETLARGKETYTQFCLVCHGLQGQGDGPLIPKFPNPPSFTSKRVMELSDGRIFYVITRGGSIMPAHNTQIDAEDRWKIIHYVRSLQQGDKK